MPHAIQIHETGGPEVLTWAEVEVGEPGPGQVRIRQEAAGLNYIDVYHRTGLYPQPLPFTPGTEGAGVVDAVGPDVSNVKAGDRVAYGGPVGGYAEVRLIDADRVVKLPDAISSEQAAAMMLQGMTAHMLLRQIYAVGAGELGLFVAADRADDGCAERFRPLADDQPDAAGCGVDQDRLARLHPMDRAEEHVRGHALQHHRRGLLGGDGVGQLHQPVGGDQAFLRVTADRTGVGDAIADV